MREAAKGYLALAGSLTEVTRQRATAAARALVSQGEATAEQVGTLVEDLLAQSRQNREAVAALVTYEVDRTLGRIGLASEGEVAALVDRVRALEAEVQRLAGSGAQVSAGASAKTTTPVADGGGAARTPSRTRSSMSAASTWSAATAPSASSATEAPAAKAPAKASAAKASAAKAPARKSSATSSSAAKSAAKASAKKSSAAKAPAKKSATRAPAKKSATKAATKTPAAKTPAKSANGKAAATTSPAAKTAAETTAAKAQHGAADVPARTDTP